MKFYILLTLLSIFFISNANSSNVIKFRGDIVESNCALNIPIIDITDDPEDILFNVKSSICKQEIFNYVDVNFFKVKNNKYKEIDLAHNDINAESYYISAINSDKLVFEFNIDADTLQSGIEDEHPTALIEMLYP